MTYWILDIDDSYSHQRGTVRPIYYHVFSSSTGAIIQYWYFFNANDTRYQWSSGYHEGDWEHVALNATYQNGSWVPDVVNFYEHDGGETRSASACWWSLSNYPTYYVLQQGFDAEHTHLHVWIAANSHASYNRYDSVCDLNINIPGSSCDLEIWDYADYNITNNARGTHGFFACDALVDLGEYYSVQSDPSSTVGRLI